MLLGAVAVWFAILVLASLNGAVRDLVLTPRLGDPIARAISTVLLCGLIALVAWFTIGWIHPRTARSALIVGILWLALTLAFEFLAGHYLFHKSWAMLLADYDIRRGRIWVLVLVTTLLVPPWFARVHRLLASPVP
jgi:hypothetical protein